ncbi:MAG: FadR family transcriptional regulator [Planctomycetota bacterium]|nr:FadR family transcriptional regulator [Planctomycetota bacterium]
MKKATKITLYDNVIEQLGDLIGKGSYRQGDSLPSERAMAEELGVSRNTLREALKALGLMGVLEVKHGGGYFVSDDLNTSIVESSFRFMSTEKPNDIRDLFATRRILEAENAALAAANSTPELVAALENDEAGIRNNLDDTEVASSYDTDYHFKIARASGNRMLNNFTKMLRWPLFRMMLKTTYIGDLMQYAVSYHRKITEAIADRNPGLARSMMNEHIMTVERTVLNDLPKAENP